MRDDDVVDVLFPMCFMWCAFVAVCNAFDVLNSFDVFDLFDVFNAFVAFRSFGVSCFCFVLLVGFVRCVHCVRFVSHILLLIQCTNHYRSIDSLVLKLTKSEALRFTQAQQH